MLAIWLLLSGAIVTAIYLESKKNERELWVMDHALAAASVGLWFWDVEKNKLCWDEQMFAIYETSRDEWSATYEDFIDRVHEEDRERVDAIVKACIENGDQYQTSFRLITGTEVRAYGRAFTEDGRQCFAGVNIPISALVFQDPKMSPDP